MFLIVFASPHARPIACDAGHGYGYGYGYGGACGEANETEVTATQVVLNGCCARRGSSWTRC